MPEPIIIRRKRGARVSPGPEPETDWWLSGGIPASTNYTIYDSVGATDQASSYINLANPGVRDATEGPAGPTWAADQGWSFQVASSRYLDSHTKLNANSTVIIWIEGVTGTTAIGSPDGHIRPSSAGTTRFQRGAQIHNSEGASAGGIIGFSGGKIFREAINVNTLAAWTNTGTYDVYIGCENSSGTAANFITGRVLRVAIYDIALTDEQFEAVTLAMYDYNQPADNAYAAQVLALNPISYYTCNQAIGSSLFDKSGNKAHANILRLPVGQAGIYGNSLSGDGDAGSAVRTIQGWATKTGINMDEFYAAAFIKIDADVANQVRIFNFYSNGETEYAAFEIRNGNQCGIFFLENGVQQSHTNIGTVIDGLWHFVGFFNSLSEGVIGLDIDGTRIQIAKTTGGFVDNLPDETWPWNMQDAFGNIQHISYYDHKFTTTERDALIAGFTPPSRLIQNTVSYYKFDELSGSVIDSVTESGNDGTASGVTMGVPGKIGTAFSFDGIDDFVEINALVAAVDLLPNGSIGFWAAPTDATPAANQNIFGFGDENGNNLIQMFINTSGQIVANCIVNGITQWNLQTDAAALLDGIFSHVIITHNGTVPALRVNNVAVAQTLTGGNQAAWFQAVPAGTLDTCRIGCRNYNNNGNERFFAGVIDEFGIWSTALSAALITELYNSGAGKTYNFQA